MIKKEDKNKINEKDIRAINRYISFESYFLNDKLRNEEPLSEEEKEWIIDLDNAIMKLDKYKGEVYRSLSFQMNPNEYETFMAKHSEGEIICYPSYTSTATEIYDDSMKVQLIIESKTGRDMREYNPKEKEIVFERNSIFIVKKKEGNKIWLSQISK